jgi:hypothetical protein
LTGKPEWKTPLGRSRHRSEAVGHNESYGNRVRLGLDWDRWRASVNTVMSPKVPQDARNFLNMTAFRAKTAVMMEAVSTSQMRDIANKFVTFIAARRRENLTSHCELCSMKLGK